MSAEALYAKSRNACAMQDSGKAFRIFRNLQIPQSTIFRNLHCRMKKSGIYKIPESTNLNEKIRNLQIAEFMDSVL